MAKTVTIVHQCLWTGVYVGNDLIHKIGPSEYVGKMLTVLETTVNLSTGKLVKAKAPYPSDVSGKISVLPEKLSGIRKYLSPLEA